jgi:hypothetical protein
MSLLFGDAGEESLDLGIVAVVAYDRDTAAAGFVYGASRFSNGPGQRGRTGLMRAPRDIYGGTGGTEFDRAAFPNAATRAGDHRNGVAQGHQARSARRAVTACPQRARLKNSGLLFV